MLEIKHNRIIPKVKHKGLYNEHKKNKVYSRLVQKLQAFRNNSSDIKFVYTCRMNDSGKIAFILDAEENVKDRSACGSTSDDATPLLIQATKSCTRPLVENSFYTDEWGTFLSAYAPIYTKEHVLNGVVGLDISLSTVNAALRTMLL